MFGGIFETDTYKKFSVEENGFTFKGEFYDFNQIAHISFCRVHTTQNRNFMKVGEADSAFLNLTMDSGKNINITIDEATYFLGVNNNKQTQLINLTDSYNFLSKKSFQKRISLYIKQVEDKASLSESALIIYALPL